MRKDEILQVAGANFRMAFPRRTSKDVSLSAESSAFSVWSPFAPPKGRRPALWPSQGKANSCCTLAACSPCKSDSSISARCADPRQRSDGATNPMTVNKKLRADDKHLMRIHAFMESRGGAGIAEKRRIPCFLSAPPLDASSRIRLLLFLPDKVFDVVQSILFS